MKKLILIAVAALGLMVAPSCQVLDVQARRVAMVPVAAACVAVNTSVFAVQLASYPLYVVYKVVKKEGDWDLQIVLFVPWCLTRYVMTNAGLIAYLVDHDPSFDNLIGIERLGMFQDINGWM